MKSISGTVRAHCKSPWPCTFGSSGCTDENRHRHTHTSTHTQAQRKFKTPKETEDGPTKCFCLRKPDGPFLLEGCRWVTTHKTPHTHLDTRHPHTSRAAAQRKEQTHKQKEDSPTKCLCPREYHGPSLFRLPLGLFNSSSAGSLLQLWGALRAQEFFFFLSKMKYGPGSKKKT